MPPPTCVSPLGRGDCEWEGTLHVLWCDDFGRHMFGSDGRPPEVRAITRDRATRLRVIFSDRMFLVVVRFRCFVDISSNQWGMMTREFQTQMRKVFMAGNGVVLLILLPDKCVHEILPKVSDWHSVSAARRTYASGVIAERAQLVTIIVLG